MGADGVQIGSRFVASEESSAHDLFKNAVVNAGDGDTALALKKLIPVRLIKNDFYLRVKEIGRQRCFKGRTDGTTGPWTGKLGMFEGEMQEGELEIGQVAGLIHEIKLLQR